MNRDEEIDIENLKYEVEKLKEENQELQVELDTLKKQLTLTDVGWSEVFIKYGKPFTSGRDLWDWLKDNCKVVLKT